MTVEGRSTRSSKTQRHTPNCIFGGLPPNLGVRPPFFGGLPPILGVNALKWVASLIESRLPKENRATKIHFPHKTLQQKCHIQGYPLGCTKKGSFGGPLPPNLGVRPPLLGSTPNFGGKMPLGPLKPPFLSSFTPNFGGKMAFGVDGEETPEGFAPEETGSWPIGPYAAASVTCLGSGG